EFRLHLEDRRQRAFVDRVGTVDALDLERLAIDLLGAVERHGHLADVRRDIAFGLADRALVGDHLLAGRIGCRLDRGVHRRLGDGVFRCGHVVLFLFVGVGVLRGLFGGGLLFRFVVVLLALFLGREFVGTLRL